MIKITRLKKKSKIPQLVRRMLELNNQRAEVGYFEASGTHTLANMHYASLAYLHEFPELGKHEFRPVLGQIKPIRGSGQDTKFFKRLLKNYVQLDSMYTAERVLGEVGQEWNQRGRQVFGNTALLVVTNNPTPLVDTGELRDNFGYRTTINMTLRYA